MGEGIPSSIDGADKKEKNKTVSVKLVGITISSTRNSCISNFKVDSKLSGLGTWSAKPNPFSRKQDP